jgi:hypothetical protein
MYKRLQLAQSVGSLARFCYFVEVLGAGEGGHFGGSGM